MGTPWHEPEAPVLLSGNRFSTRLLSIVYTLITILNKLSDPQFDPILILGTLTAPFTPYYVNGPAYGGLIGMVNAFVAFGQALLKSGKQTGMSLFWFMGTYSGVPYHAHPGGGGGYYCELRLYAETGSFKVRNSSGFSNEKWMDGVDVGFFEVERFSEKNQGE